MTPIERLLVVLFIVAATAWYISYEIKKHKNKKDKDD